MQNKTSEKELNAFLKGEHMAIDGYEKYIQSVSEENVKNQLQNIQKDHKQHAIQVAERIQDLGGKPEDGVGVAGKMAEAVSNVKDMGRVDTLSVLKQAYEGEMTGIKMADELVKGDLDQDSANIVNNILNVDKGHLNVLDNLIKSHDGIQ